MNLDTIITGLLSQAFRPTPKGSIAEWGAENVPLSAEESAALPGNYNVAAEPWATILFDFAQDPNYDELIIRKPSRMGYTLAFFVLMMWWLTHLSTNVIFCIDNAKEVKKVSRTRIIPLIRSVKSLGDVVPANDRALTNETLFLKGKTVFMAGAQSISQVTNKTASLVAGDEVDQFEDFASGEANAAEHLRDRVMDVPGSKLIFGGKPRNAEDFLTTEYQTGSRHKLFVPCPHCGLMQTLEWKNVKFDHCRDEDGGFDQARVLKETFIQCISPECRLTGPEHGKIREHHKRWMLETKAGRLVRAQWRQTNLGQDEDKPEPRKMSVQINQLYSLRPKITFGAIAVHFIQASRKGGRKLAHFFRTRMGEPHQERQTIIKNEHIRALAKDSTYKHGQCPVLPVFIAMAVDVQIDVKKWSKVAFLSTGEAFIIDYGECLTFDALYEIAEQDIEILDWGDVDPDNRDRVMVDYMWIDEGDGDNSMKDVRDFCIKERSRSHPINGGHWIFPCKGAGGIQIKGAVDERSRSVDIKVNGETKKYEFNAYHLSHNEFATELYLQRIGKHDEICAAMDIMRKHPSKRVPLPAPRLHLMKGADDEFIDELCAEKRQLKKVRGRLRWVWVDPADPNDYGDTVKYCLAMWHFVRADYGWMPDEVEAYPGETSDDEGEGTAKKKGRDYVLKDY